jgi:hypothetical protein
VRCHTFITESTFGLPYYCWPTKQLFADINVVAHQCSGGTRIGAVLFVCGSGLPSGVDASIGPLMCMALLLNQVFAMPV